MTLVVPSYSLIMIASCELGDWDTWLLGIWFLPGILEAFQCLSNCPPINVPFSIHLDPSLLLYTIGILLNLFCNRAYSRATLVVVWGTLACILIFVSTFRHDSSVWKTVGVFSHYPPRTKVLDFQTMFLFFHVIWKKPTIEMNCS